MHPILFSLRLTPETAQAVGLIVTLLCAVTIIWDGEVAHRGQRRWMIAAQAAGFIAVGVVLCLKLLTRDRLGELLVIDVRAWGVLGVVTVVTTFLIQRRLGRELGVTGEQLLSIWVYCGFGGLFGARFLHVLVNWSSYAGNPIGALAFWDGGMVYVGGLLGCLGVAVVYVKRACLPLRLLDVLALSMALTQGIGRIGCLLAGCCYGRETTLPLGVRFGPGSIALYTLQQTGEVAADALSTPPLHPTQLYEAVACFLLGGALYALYRWRRPAPGIIIGSYFVGYSVIRFFLELLRNDPDRRFVLRYPEVSPLFLSTSQTAALVMIVVAVLFLRGTRLRG